MVISHMLFVNSDGKTSQSSSAGTLFVRHHGRLGMEVRAAADSRRLSHYAVPARLGRVVHKLKKTEIET